MDYSSSFRRNDSELQPHESSILNAQYADVVRYPGVRAKEGQPYVNTESADRKNWPSQIFERCLHSHCLFLTTGLHQGPVATRYEHTCVLLRSTGCVPMNWRSMAKVFLAHHVR